MPVLSPLTVFLVVAAAIIIVLGLLFLAMAFIVSISSFGDYDNDPYEGLFLDGEDYDRKTSAPQRR